MDGDMRLCSRAWSGAQQEACSHVSAPSMQHQPLLCVTMGEGAFRQLLVKLSGQIVIWMR